MVCSCPPKGPELNLLVMASISWLDKIPPLLSLLLSLTQHPFLAQELSFNFITQQGRFMSCHICLSFAPHPVHVNLTKQLGERKACCQDTICFSITQNSIICSFCLLTSKPKLCKLYFLLNRGSSLILICPIDGRCKWVNF